MAVPQLGRWLNYRAMPLPGHPSAVRVQGVAFGASERLVVSPGHEKDGILTLPGGQSGHFMSAHYQDGFAAWATGEAAPLLAGDAVSRFTITPK
jgi:penicillin amidase